MANVSPVIRNPPGRARLVTQSSRTGSSPALSMRTSHFGMFLGPAIFDGQVLAFDEATFLQPHVETGHLQREGIGRGAVQKPDHRHPRLLRARPEWPRGPRSYFDKVRARNRATGSGIRAPLA